MIYFSALIHTATDGYLVFYCRH